MFLRNIFHNKICIEGYQLGLGYGTRTKPSSSPFHTSYVCTNACLVSLLKLSHLLIKYCLIKELYQELKVLTDFTIYRTEGVWYSTNLYVSTSMFQKAVIGSKHHHIKVLLSHAIKNVITWFSMHEELQVVLLA